MEGFPVSGPIAGMFWLDEGLGSEMYIDGKGIEPVVQSCFTCFPPCRYCYFD